MSLLTKFVYFLIGILVIIPVVIILYFKRSYRYWIRKNVPHIPPTFPYGNYADLFSRKIHFGECVARYYEVMKSRGVKFAGFFLLARPTFMVIDPELSRHLLTKDFNIFNERNFFYNEADDPVSAHLLAVSGDKWRRMRTKMTPAFTSSKLKMMFKIVVDCSEILVNTLQDHIDGNVTVRVKDLFSIYSTDVIGVCAFGIDMHLNPNCVNEFRVKGQKAVEFDIWRILTMTVGSACPNLCRFFGLRQIPKEISDFFIKMVGETVHFRESTGTVRNDFMQLLINMNNDVKNDESFTIEQLAAQCFIFFLAGFETSATTMAFALYEITKNPEIESKLRKEIVEVLEKYDGEITYEAIKEMKFLGQVVDETLRVYTPAYFIGRVATQDYKVPDYDIILDKGTHILVSITGLHRDPEYYPEPEKFIPERFSEENKGLRHPYVYLPFGEGPRNCIGMRFGLMEAKVALARIIPKFTFKMNSKTPEPLKMDPNSLLLNVLGAIYLDCEKYQQNE